MPYPTGLILGLHKERQKGDFVVLKRVTGLDYPPVNITTEIESHMKTDGYHHVWFVEIKVPE